MKEVQCFAALLVCLLLAVTGCKESDDAQLISLVIEGDPAVKVLLEQIIKNDPLVIVDGTETKYTMQVIKPDSSIDYKIIKVIPDPSVDYKIIIIDPISGNKVAGLSDQLGNVLLGKIQQKQKDSKK